MSEKEIVLLSNYGLQLALCALISHQQQHAQNVHKYVGYTFRPKVTQHLYDIINCNQISNWN